MHASLSPRASAILLGVWTAGAVAVSLIAPAVPWTLLAVGIILGVGLGVLQLRALRESRAALIASQTASEVRRALAATGAGRAYLYALWGSVLPIIAVAYALSTGGKYFGALAGYCALAAVREVVSLREAVVLQALAVER